MEPACRLPAPSAGFPVSISPAATYILLPWRRVTLHRAFLCSRDAVSPLSQQTAPKTDAVPPRSISAPDRSGIPSTLKPQANGKRSLRALAALQNHHGSSKNDSAQIDSRCRPADFFYPFTLNAATAMAAPAAPYVPAALNVSGICGNIAVTQAQAAPNAAPLTICAAPAR